MRIEQLDIKHQLVAMILLGIKMEDSSDIFDVDSSHDSIWITDQDGKQYLIKITEVESS